MRHGAQSVARSMIMKLQKVLTRDGGVGNHVRRGAVIITLSAVTVMGTGMISATPGTASAAATPRASAPAATDASSTSGVSSRRGITQEDCPLMLGAVGNLAGKVPKRQQQAVQAAIAAFCSPQKAKHAVSLRPLYSTPGSQLCLPLLIIQACFNTWWAGFSHGDPGGINYGAFWCDGYHNSWGWYIDFGWPIGVKNVLNFYNDVELCSSGQTAWAQAPGMWGPFCRVESIPSIVGFGLDACGVLGIGTATITPGGDWHVTFSGLNFHGFGIPPYTCEIHVHWELQVPTGSKTLKPTKIYSGLDGCHSAG